MLDHRISEQLTFMFIVLYLFRDWLDVLFHRGNGEDEHNTSFFNDLILYYEEQRNNFSDKDPGGKNFNNFYPIYLIMNWEITIILVKEIMLYNIFKKLTLSIHLDAIKSELTPKTQKMNQIDSEQINSPSQSFENENLE